MSNNCISLEWRDKWRECSCKNVQAGITQNNTHINSILKIRSENRRAGRPAPHSLYHAPHVQEDQVLYIGCHVSSCKIKNKNRVFHVDFSTSSLTSCNFFFFWFLLCQMRRLPSSPWEVLLWSRRGLCQLNLKSRSAQDNRTMNPELRGPTQRSYAESRSLTSNSCCSWTRTCLKIIRPLPPSLSVCSKSSWNTYSVQGCWCGLVQSMCVCVVDVCDFACFHRFLCWF